MKPLLVILDAGHGGIKDGRYVTAPSKMYKHADGSVAMEGVINRKIKNAVITLLKESNILCLDASIGDEDWQMSARVKFANSIMTKYGKDFRCLYVSIHSNAGGGSGFEIFTSPGLTASDACAELWAYELMDTFPEFPLRTDLSDGDLDKEAKFYVLIHTAMPSVLAELLFFDNPKDWAYQQTDEYISKVSMATVRFIKNVESDINW